jgi:hypothetical protein
MWNESVRILKICGKNLYVHTENIRNEVNFLMKFRCSYTENTQNESVCILRILGVNLFVY